MSRIMAKSTTGDSVRFESTKVPEDVHIPNEELTTNNTPIGFQATLDIGVFYCLKLHTHC